MQIDVDELYKPKYLQQFLIHVSDKSAQLEIAGEIIPRLK